MRVACRITAIARKAAADAVRPGVTTGEIDRIVRKTIEEAGAKPSFLGYGGFPGSACISINDEVIHGIPSKHRVVQEGDIVKVDVGAYINGYHGDCACTAPQGTAWVKTCTSRPRCRTSATRGTASACSAV